LLIYYKIMLKEVHIQNNTYAKEYIYIGGFHVTLSKGNKCAKAIAAIGISTVMVFSTSAIADAASILKLGSRGSEVSRVQSSLKDMGLYTYPEITGYYGSITKDAVIKFQAQKGLTRDGIVGPNTWNALFGTGTASRGSTGNHSTLRQGSRGDEVRLLQQLLKNKGYYKGSIDGIFGSGTRNAVVQFQRAAGLSADGIVGTKTWSALGGNGTSTSRGSSSGDISGLLKKGSRGAAVSELQTKLKEKGFYSGSIDGIFGSGTENAVKAFQRASGLTADGIAGPKTIAALNQSGGSSRGTTDRPNGSVELIHWNDVDSVWPRNTSAVIVDVDTGKRINVYRSGGTNHADVETASAADTATLKSLYGGSFSWDRRAVVVEVGGRRLAASMAGMPHAGRDDQPNRAMVSNRSGGYGYGSNLDAIKGNNMDGVFDVHFYQSRTHGSNKVDSAHQSMVKKAAGIR